MKALTLALLLSLPVPRLAPPAKPSLVPTKPGPAPKGGRWHMAANGHAVYCYGPVLTMPQANGGLLRVATFCRGDRTMVPLRD
jgi:hypothetical protein